MRIAEMWVLQVCLALIWGLWRGEAGQVLALRVTVVPVMAVALWMAVKLAWAAGKR